MKYLSTLALLLAFAASQLGAQTTDLIKNANTTTTDVFSSSFPGKGIALNNYLYFPAENNQGREMWRTDGSGTGTALVKDIESIFDRADANPRLAVTISGSLYFFAREGLHLYRYDPATGGMTEPYVGGDGITEPTEVVTIGEYIFFASEGYYSGGVELLRYNTTDDILDIFDVTGDNTSSFPHNLTVKGDTIFFAADDGFNGTELWIYDHNSESIQLVEDINPGQNSSNPSSLIVYNDKLFFSADDGTNDTELWSSDGSDFGTDLYYDINTSGGSNPTAMVVFANLLFFSADDGFDGYEPWFVNDNSQSTQQLADINFSGDSHPGNTGYKKIGDTVLYFAATNGFQGMELWRIKSTNINPVMVANILPSSGSSWPRDFHSLGDTLIFVANNGLGWELWRSNGTAGTTVMIQDIQPNSVGDTVKIVGVLGTRLYFGANNSVNGVELWKTGGTAATTALVKDINYGSAISSDPHWFQPMGGQMYFTAKTNNDFYHGLWRTDGSSGGTVEVKPGSAAANFNIGFAHAATLGSNIIFSAYTDTTGYEPWRSDGTLAGTVKIASIISGATGSNPESFITLGAATFFTADDGVNGVELWKTDGAAAGTVLVKDIRPGALSSSISQMTVSGGKLFFTADNGVAGRELWVSDGTTAGTIMLQDIMPGAGGSAPGHLYSTGTTLYFTATNLANGDEVWTSDGTPAGTALLKDINPGTGGSSPDGFAQLGAYVYFSATSVTNVAAKVWRTDGTSAGTAQFFDVNYPFLFKTAGSRVVFMTLPANSTNGFHLWSTDGTVAGTTEIEDFLPGELGYVIIDDFPVYNGHVVYWLDDRISGQELWTSAGTPSSTQKHDIAPGPPSSYPRGARGLNPLIFSADDGSVNGREPWKVELSAIPLPRNAITLQAETQGTSALLRWNSRSPTHRSFELQRSSNGIDFGGLGQVTAAAGKTEYPFTDEQPLKGTSYYRVKRLLQDGSHDFSNIETVRFDGAQSAKAFPNPAVDMLNIQTAHSFVTGELTVRTMSGQLVLTQSVSGNAIRIPLHTLALGMYSAEVSEGSYLVKLLFVKQ